MDCSERVEGGVGEEGTVSLKKRRWRRRRRRIRI